MKNLTLEDKLSMQEKLKSLKEIIDDIQISGYVYLSIEQKLSMQEKLKSLKETINNINISNKILITTFLNNGSAEVFVFKNECVTFLNNFLKDDYEVSNRVKAIKFEKQ